MAQPSDCAKSKHKSAETLAAEARAEDEKEWIVFDAATSAESLDTWLKMYSPSTTSCDDIGWIAVRGNRRNESREERLDLLEEAWDAMQTLGEPINLETISGLAKAYSVTAGKWMIFAKTGAKVDLYWRLIARGIIGGQLPAISAKVSPCSNLDAGGNHVICVYNDDFTNQEEVYLLEGAMRKIGIKCQLSYKPDVYTHLGVYRKNKWHLSPTIYKSVYEIISKQSKITKMQIFQELISSSN